MNVQGGDTIGAIGGSRIIIQGISYDKGEGGPEGLPQAGMTKRAGVQSLLPAQETGINDIATRLFAWMSLVFVALTDLYVRLVASGVIHDYGFHF